MIRKVLKVLVLSIAGLFLIVLAVNAWDEELKPEAKALIEQKLPPTEQGLKAYFYMLGLRKGGAQDPEAEGRALWEEAQKLTPEARNEFFDKQLKNKHEIWPSIKWPARKKDQPVADYLKEVRKGEREDLTKINEITDSYIKLIFYKDFSWPEPVPLFSRADVPIQEFLKGHRQLTYRLGVLAEQKLYEKLERVIREENEFYQTFFGRNYLLGVMIAHVIIEENAGILAAEMKKNPGLKFKPETIASFKTPGDKDMLTSAMNNEFRFFARMANEMTDGGLLTSFNIPDTESLLSLDKLKTKFLIKRNATLNRYYDLVQQDLNKQTWEDGNPLTMIRNPGGKWLTRILMINVHGRARKMEQRTKSLDELVASLEDTGPS